MTPAKNRHRIIEKRGPYADSWLRELTKQGDVERFVRFVTVTHSQHYGVAPEPHGAVMIPRASETHELTVEGRQFLLVFCRDPQYILLDELL